MRYEFWCNVESSFEEVALNSIESRLSAFLSLYVYSAVLISALVNCLSGCASNVMFSFVIDVVGVCRCSEYVC